MSDLKLIRRDGEPVAINRNERAALHSLCRASSADHALKYEGYSVENLDDALPDGWGDLDTLGALETLATGQTADLKIDTGELRVWLSRMEPHEEPPVTVEGLANGRWSTLHEC